MGDSWLIHSVIMSVGDITSSESSPMAQDVGVSPRGNDVFQHLTADEVLGNFGSDTETLQHVVGGVDGVPLGSILQSSGVDVTLLRLWTRVTDHQKKIESILFYHKTKVSNSIRAQVITELNAIVKTSAEFQAAAAWRGTGASS